MVLAQSLHYFVEIQDKEKGSLATFQLGNKVGKVSLALFQDGQTHLHPSISIHPYIHT